MSKHSNKPVSLAVTAVLVSGLGLSASAFAMSDLAQGYLLGAGEAAHASEGKTAEGKCGEGKCGAGKCSMAKMDTDKDGRISSVEFAAAHNGDSSKFAAHDPNSDGFIDTAEMKAHHEGKCGEGKCGANKKAPAKKAADKAGMEGKCGEGKCGGQA